MSARELLKQVKALDAREREKFVEAVLALEASPSRGRAKSKRVRWPDVEARTKRIMGTKVLPNLVISERDEEPY